jgi:REP element-mobilizing transposase RayT
MSWVRVWMHVVFTTKNHEAFLNKEIRETVFAHIKQNAKEKEIWLDSINGYKDHVHCLISINRELSISKICQQIKGESSFWINKNKLTKSKFIWQDDYWAVSVGEDHIDTLRNYINNQEEHHRKKSFEEEVNDFFKSYDYSTQEK